MIEKVEKALKVVEAAANVLSSDKDSATVAGELMTALEITPAHQEQIKRFVEIAQKIIVALESMKKAPAVPPVTE